MKSLTHGAHHIGLTVSRLEQSATFFTQVLGWKEVHRKPDYPAIFVSDGTVMLTLWSVQQEPPRPFDRAANVGLHHLALAVDSEAALQHIHHKLLSNGVEVEFAPEPVGAGEARHLMCYEPSGIRLEFFWPGIGRHD